MATISTTISGGVTLGTPAYGSPLTITATGAVLQSAAGAAAIYGPNSGGPWAVVNQGSVSSSGSNGAGIVLAEGGLVSNSGNVTGAASGIVIKGGLGSVDNFGSVVSQAQFDRSGVYLGNGGNVTNGSARDGSALIEAQWIGVELATPGTVTNFGTIESLGTQSDALSHNGLGVFMPKGGDVVNRGLISAASFTGIYIGGSGGVPTPGATGIVTNSGTVESAGHTGIALASGGTVTNTGTVESNDTFAHSAVYINGPEGGVIVNGQKPAASGIAKPGWTGSGAGYYTTASSYTAGWNLPSNGTAVQSYSGGGSISDAGSSFGSVTFDEIGVGGTLVNVTVGLALANPAIIEAQWVGAELANGGTLVNYGTVESLGTEAAPGGHHGVGAFLPKGGEILNGGLIEATYFNAIYGGGIGGVANPGATLTVANAGTVESGGGEAIGLAEGGVIVNGGTGDTGALIEGGTSSVAIYVGGSNGTLNAGAAATIVNFGTIENNTTHHSAIVLAEGGSVANYGSKSLIEGGLNGVSTTGNGGSGGPASIINAGTVEGQAGAGILLGDGGEVTNSGLIEGLFGVDVAAGNATVVNAGTVKGSGGTALYFAPGTTALLVDEPGAKFGGAVLGPGAGGTLELAHGKPGSLLGLGTQFQLFGTIKVDPKATWTLSGIANDAALVNDGKVIVTGTDTLVLGEVSADPGKHGTIEMAKDGAAVLFGLVASGQTLLFRNTHNFSAFLQLNDVAEFSGTIKGFKKGDTIDLAGTAVDGRSFSAGTLTLTDGGTMVAALSFKGHYKTKQFHLSSDGSGGTDITIGKPAGGTALFVNTDPGQRGGGFTAREPLVAGGGAGRNDGFSPFGSGGGSAAPIAVGDGNPPLSWLSDPFHFWTIQG